jgi:hypothetical protein
LLPSRPCKFRHELSSEDYSEDRYYFLVVLGHVFRALLSALVEASLKTCQEASSDGLPFIEGFAYIIPSSASKPILSRFRALSYAGCFVDEELLAGAVPPVVERPQHLWYSTRFSAFLRMFLLPSTLEN